MRTSVELEGPLIARSIEDVFEVVGNLENSPRWGLMVTSVRDPVSPDGVGAVFLSKSRIIGQKVEHRSEVTRSDPPTEFSYANRFENGVIERTRISFSTVEGGTRIDLASEVEIEQVPQVLAPLADLFVKQRMSSLVNNLEKVFAPPSSSVMGAATMIAIGAILLATVGLNYLIAVLPEGEWSTVVALLAASLISAGVAAIIWRVARDRSNEETLEPTPAERKPVEEEN